VGGSSTTPLTILLTLTGLIGVFILVLSLGGWFLVKALNPEPTRAQARLANVVGTTSNKEQSAFGDWLENQTVKTNLGPSKGMFGLLLKAIADKLNLEVLLLQAGITTHSHVYAAKSMVLPFLLGFLLFVFTHNVMGLFIAIIGPAMGWGFLKWKAIKQLGLLESQLPDALNVLASSLRAGHSFQAAIQLLAEQLPSPIVSVFANISNDMKLGVPAKESLTKLIDDVPLTDYRIFSTAVLVQREVGGNLAEVMDRLSYTIRERFKLKRQVTVLTSQPRLSAYILGGGPLILFGIFYLFFNSYLQPLYTNIIGQIALKIAFIMQLIGFYIMWRIVDIKY